MLRFTTQMGRCTKEISTKKLSLPKEKEMSSFQMAHSIMEDGVMLKSMDTELSLGKK